MKKLLVTTGLPYANGSLHLGHILENIQADIWVRLQKMMGKECYFVCGEDAHGTPVMLSALEKGIKPEELAAEKKLEHAKDLADFYVEFDNYYTTHSEENRALATDIYQKLKAKGDIIVKEIEQFFDPEKNLFLPDRFIKGTCPRCKAQEQYGDNCEVCGASYNPTDLIEPRSRLSNAKPILKKSQHYFFALEKYGDFLRIWAEKSGSLQPEIIHKLQEWLSGDLKNWDISRDAPYFGFLIPGETDKYFYVWLDAPIGYMASFKNLCGKRQDLDFDEYWQSDKTTELYHFIGKDIVYFHTLFWPAMLYGAGYRTPTKIFVHGFLTVDGEKMSKSRGTFITVRDYLNQYQNPEYLRYYFAAKLSSGIGDIDLNLQDFKNRVNSDLVGKVVNIASRSAKFINEYFEDHLAATIPEQALFDEFVKAADTIAARYQSLQYSAAIREIMLLADKANQYIDAKKPWAMIKDTAARETVQQICTLSLNLFRLLILYLKPVLPKMAQDVEAFLKIAPLSWEVEQLQQPLLNHVIAKFQPLMQRIK